MFQSIVCPGHGGGFLPDMKIKKAPTGVGAFPK